MESPPKLKYVPESNAVPGLIAKLNPVPVVVGQYPGAMPLHSSAFVLYIGCCGFNAACGFTTRSPQILLYLHLTLLDINYSHRTAMGLGTRTVLVKSSEMRLVLE